MAGGNWKNADFGSARLGTGLEQHTYQSDRRFCESHRPINRKSIFAAECRRKLELTATGVLCECSTRIDHPLSRRATVRGPGAPPSRRHRVRGARPASRTQGRILSARRVAGRRSHRSIRRAGACAAPATASVRLADAHPFGWPVDAARGCSMPPSLVIATPSPRRAWLPPPGQVRWLGEPFVRSAPARDTPTRSRG